MSYTRGVNKGTQEALMSRALTMLCAASVVVSPVAASTFSTAIDLEIVSEDNVNMRQRTTTEVTSLRDGVQLVRFNLLNGRSKNFRNMWDEREDKLTVTGVRTWAIRPSSPCFATSPPGPPRRTSR